MRRKLRFDSIGFIFLMVSVFLYGQSVDSGKGMGQETAGKSIGLTAVENNIKRLNKSVEALPESQIRQNVRIRRDPFVPLIPAVSENSADIPTEKISIPELVVHGIIFDRKASMAIIGNEVKKEGEFVGEWEIYRITEDKVFIKHGESMFPIDINK